MKNSCVPQSVGCLVMLGALAICVSSISVGSTGIWFTLVFAVIGLTIGGAIGQKIGVASGGTAVNGAALFGVLFAVAFALLANSGANTVASWWASKSPVETRNVSIDSIAETVKANEEDVSEISYEEIEDTYESTPKEDWRKYKRQLFGKRVQWSGMVDDIGEDSITLNLGQNQLTRRIQLADISSEVISELKQHQSIRFEGKIYEINELLGLNLYLTDIKFIEPE